MSLHPFPAASVRSHLAHARAIGLDRVIASAAARHGVRADVLTAIGSRESHLGQMPPLARDWTGDRGHGRGVFQIDDRWHGPFVRGHANDDHAAHADYAARFLKRLVTRYGGDYVRALAAYNAGPGNVDKALRQGRSAEHYTTGGDYATDVLARARIVAGGSAGGAAASSGLLSSRGPNWSVLASAVGAAAFFINPTAGALTGVSLGLLAYAQSSRQSS